MYKKEHIFVAGAARFSDLIYLSIRSKELDAKSASHSLFVAYYRGERLFIGSVDWDTVAMCVVKQPSEKLVAISANGTVLTYVGGSKGEEKMQAVSVGLRGLAVVGGHGYACGMKRQVFRRSGDGLWTPMHAPEPAKTDKGTVIGFEAIGGFSASEVYAAGWRGEIWRYDGKTWRQTDSPSNQILTAIACGGDGLVYICGKRGTLIKGRGDNWSVINKEGAAEDLWDIHWFNDRLYASSLSRIYELQGDELRLVDVGGDRPSTCLRLTSAQGILWSVGPQDLLSFDGKKWMRVE